MIKRIKSIKNIGTYCDANCSECEFNALTYIYGPNSYGKSTLVSILKSFKTDNSELIKERKTVNSNGDVEVVLLTSGKGTIEYKKDRWITIGTSDVSRNNIHIFDSDFVEKNVFTNSEVEHKNTENLTEFVLGEKSIDLNKTLLNIISVINECNFDNKSKREMIEKACPKLNFSKLISCDHSQNTIQQSDINELKSMLENINSLTDNYSKIGQCKLMERINISFVDFINQLNEMQKYFSAEYSFNKDDIYNKYTTHVEKCFFENSKADLLISELAKCKKTDLCPFCGSNTESNVLVNSYIDIFCDDLQKYNDNVEKLLKFNPVINFSDLELSLSRNKEKFNEIHELATKISIDIYKSDLDENIEILNNNITFFNKIIEIKKVDFVEMQAKKRADRYVSYPFAFSDLIEKLGNINIAIEKYNDILHKINNVIENIPHEQQKVNLLEEKNKLTQKIENCEYQLARSQWSKEINTYLDNEVTIDGKNTEKAKIKVEFETSNKQFIAKFFKVGNDYFKKLNSGDFEIKERGINRGNKKTFSFSLYFHKKEISQKNIGSALSESDKRALALSIFLSAMQIKDLPNAILIFDDPIVSFDMGRIEQFTQIINLMSEKCAQIIIFTHYENFYKLLTELRKKRAVPCSFLKIGNANNSKKLMQFDLENEPFIIGDYKSLLYRAVDFISCKIDSFSHNDMRILLEKMIEYKYVQEMRNAKNEDLGDFSKKLKFLKNENFIDEKEYKQILNIKDILDDYSHNLSASSPDDSRKTLQNIFNILNNK